jgi:hypothetical protein
MEVSLFLLLLTSYIFFLVSIECVFFCMEVSLFLLTSYIFFFSRVDDESKIDKP